MAIALAFLAALSVTAGCNGFDFPIPQGSDSVPTEPSVVKILKNDSGEWKMTVDGEAFYFNGAATNRFYTDVKKFGGNTIRLYSPRPAETRQIMDDSYQAGLKVYMGLGLAAATAFDYTNAEKIDAQKELILSYVKQYRNHPALLCWCIGNEAEASNENNTDLWKAIGDIAASIKELDPNHPITNTLAGAAVARIKNLATYAPDVDFVSINSYYPIVGAAADNMVTAGVDLPYMITEFGPRGSWQMNAEPSRILPWGDNYEADSKALVEETSSEKEEVYMKVWTDDIKAKEKDGCIGSFVFVWGYLTHGEVLTWYGTHTTDRYSFGVCDAMQKCWTGSYPEIRAPRIESRNDLRMNGKVAEDAIKVGPGSSNSAQVTATTNAEVNLRYHWFIFKEGDKKSDGSIPDGIAGLVEADGKASVSFKAPSSSGAYRLYVYVLDDVNKKAASACIPFFVE